MNMMIDCIAESTPSQNRTAHSRSPRLLFVAGIMPRSGTNFLGRLLAAHPDVRRPDGHKELPLLEVADRFADFHSSFNNLRKDNRLNYSFDDFARAFGDGFFNILRERVADSSSPYDYLLHGNPKTNGIEYLPRFFPAAKLVFLVRDG